MKIMLSSLALFLVSLLTLDLAHAAQSTANVESELVLKSGDEGQNEIRALKAEMLIAKNEKKAISQLQKLITKYKGSRLESSLWFRLSELYMRQSNSERFFELVKSSETGLRMIPAEVQKSSSRKSIQSAIDVYARIQKDFKKFEDMDFVIFNMAYAHQLLGEEKKAQDNYHKLIQERPNSFLVPDAHLAVGEMYFEKRKFSLALEEFMSVQKFPQAKVYTYGIYKTAWTRYNMQDSLGGLKELEKVIALSGKSEQQTSLKKMDLRKEALNDMVLFYSESQSPEKAYAYFLAQGGEEEVGRLMLRLSTLYVRHARFQDIGFLLKEFVNSSPLSKDRPVALYELVFNSETLKERQKGLNYLNDLDQMCSATSTWSQTYKDQPDVLKVCEGKLLEASSKITNAWHKLWKKVTDPVVGKFARQGYEIYLKNQKKPAELVTARYAYAELLFQMSDFRVAAEQYFLVSTQADKANIRHDAGYAATVSLEKAVNNKWNEEDEKQFIIYSTNYIKANPKGQFVDGLSFKKAFIAYEKNRYEEAAPLLKRLSQKTTFPQAGKAQDLYMDILNHQKNFQELRVFSQALLKKDMSAERRQSIHKLFSEAYFSENQNLEEQNKDSLALEGYLKFARENPQSQLAEKAWWNSLQLLLKTKKWLEYVSVSEQFATKFPKSNHAQESVLKAAQLAESMGELASSARLLEKYAELKPQEKQKWLPIYARFYDLSGNWKKAFEIYETAMKTTDASEWKKYFSAVYELSLRQKSEGQARGFEKIIREKNVQPYLAAMTADKAEELFAEKKYSEAFRVASQVLSMGRKEVAPKDSARARMVQASVLEDEFLTQSVKARPDRIALVLGLKTEKLDKVQRAYQDVGHYGDATYSIKALQKLARCYGHFVSALKNFDVLGEIDPQDMKQLKSEIDKLMSPLEEKQVETLLLAQKQAKRAELHNGMISEIQVDLNKVNLQTTDAIQTSVQVPSAALPHFSTIIGGSI